MSEEFSRALKGYSTLKFENKIQHSNKLNHTHTLFWLKTSTKKMKNWLIEWSSLFPIFHSMVDDGSMSTWKKSFEFGLRSWFVEMENISRLMICWNFPLKWLKLRDPWKCDLKFQSALEFFTEISLSIFIQNTQ